MDPDAEILSDVEMLGKDAEELELEKIVFGDKEGFEANLRKVENLYDYSDEDPEDAALYSSDEGLEGDEEEDLFFIDENADSAVAHDPEAMEIDAKEDEVPAAWIDSDDEKLAVNVTTNRLRKLRETHAEEQLSGATYVSRLRAQYEKIYPRPDWADGRHETKVKKTQESFEEEDEEDKRVGANASGLAEILQQTNTFVQQKTKLLPPGRIDILRLKDANFVRRSRGGIRSMQFHPLHPLLVTGGTDRTLRIYNIDGKTNAFVSLIHFRDMPIQTLLFVPKTDGSTANWIYAGGYRRFMNRWDLSSGDVEKISRMYGQDQFQLTFEYFRVLPFGNLVALRANSGRVNIISGRTGQFVKSYKIDGDVADLQFTQDEKLLIVLSSTGGVWEFNVQEPVTSILRRWTDAGAVRATTLALGGPGDRWMAIGTQSGVVNLFDRTTFAALEQGRNPTVYKEVSNLVTPITDTKFSPDGQILCISSQEKRDALRLVHMPLATVFANWPTSNTPLGRVTVTEFSPNAQMLAIANDVGRVTLWRLNHY